MLLMATGFTPLIVLVAPFRVYTPVPELSVPSFCTLPVMVTARLLAVLVNVPVELITRLPNVLAPLVVKLSVPATVVVPVMAIISVLMVFTVALVMVSVPATGIVPANVPVMVAPDMVRFPEMV